MTRRPNTNRTRLKEVADGGPRHAPETEHAFIAAATRLFAEKGYNGTSIADLANELGLSTASLYYHVSGKQELLLRVLDTGMADFLSRLEAVADADVGHRQKLRLAVENHLDFVLTNPEAVTVFLRERRFLEPPYREQYQTGVDRYDRLFALIIQEAMDAGDIPPGDGALVRLSILGMINWVVAWYRPAGRLSAAQILEGMTELIVDRMLGPAGDSSPTTRLLGAVD